MIIAVELHPDLVDAKRSTDSKNTIEFTLVGKEGLPESLCIDSTVRKDVARALIAHDVNALVTNHLPLESFVLLKSYGIRVYSAPMEPMSINDVIDACEKGELTEITSVNYHTAIQNAASAKVGCSPTSSEDRSGIKEAL